MSPSAGGRRSRVVVVEDHPIVREGLVQLVGRQPDLEVVGEAADTRVALRLVRDTSPDIVVVDLSLGAEGGLELIKVLAESHPSVASIVLSMHDETVFAERALRAGARAYVTKQEATDVLLAAMRQVLGGKVWFSSRVNEMLLRRAVLRTKPASESKVTSLSDREMDVLTLLGGGMGTREIATKLHVSVKTVESHRANMKEKLGLESATQLVAFAARWVVDRQSSGGTG